MRAGGVVVRRVFAGITQFRVAATLVERRRRPARPPADLVAPAPPDGDLVARAGVDTDAAIAVLAPIPFATGTVLMIVVSAVWLLVTDRRPRRRRDRRVPVLLVTNVVYQRRVDRHFDAAQDELGSCRRASTRASRACSSSRRTAPSSARPSGWRRSPGGCATRGSRRSACAARSRRCSTCCRRWPTSSSSSSAPTGCSSGDLTVGELTSFIYLFTLLVFPLRLIGYALSEMPHSLAGWTRVREVLDEPIEPDPLRC